MSKFASARPARCWVLAVAFLAACGGGGDNNQATPAANSPANPGTSVSIIPARNVLAVSVNSGPANTVNLAFGSVTVCAPGSTTNCQTIGGIMIDTGSTGLRILSSALSPVLALRQQTDASGNPIAECAQFADGFSWGPVKVADVTIAGEQAKALSVQIIGDPAFSTIPRSCSSVGRSRGTVGTLGANGILGISAFRQDCGAACAQSGNPGIYFICPATGCQPVARPLSEQVQNPVALFAGDNNGAMLQLPAVPPGGSAVVEGSLVFGIGTQANNGLGGAAVFALNPSNGQFTTLYKGLALIHSFIDSGSNALFFQDASITACSSTTRPGFYCPASTQSLSATIQGVNGTNAAISFDIANADALLASGGLTAFSNLGSPISSVASFDWGLPFFYGRSVFVGLEGATVPGGAAGPFVAF